MPVNCPPPSPLNDLTRDNCAVDYSQLIKMFIAAPDALETFDETAVPSTGITLETSWDDRLAASDGSKIQGSEILHGLQIPQSEFITKGGNSNETAFGDELIISNGNVTVTGMMYNVSAEVAQSYEILKAYQVLRVYFVNKDGRVLAKKVSGTGAGDDVYQGLEIRNFGITTRGVTGLDDVDQYMIRFSLRSNWEEGVELIEPGFDLISKY